MPKPMTCKELAQELLKTPDAQVWLSSDEEGNSFSPLISYPTWGCVSFEREENIVCLWPSRQYGSLSQKELNNG
jgi:hypothetical protein